MIDDTGLVLYFMLGTAQGPFPTKHAFPNRAFRRAIHSNYLNRFSIYHVGNGPCAVPGMRFAFRKSCRRQLHARRLLHCRSFCVFCVHQITDLVVCVPLYSGTTQGSFPTKYAFPNRVFRRAIVSNYFYRLSIYHLSCRERPPCRSGHAYRSVLQLLPQAHFLKQPLLSFDRSGCFCASRGRSRPICIIGYEKQCRINQPVRMRRYGQCMEKRDSDGSRPAFFLPKKATVRQAE